MIRQRLLVLTVLFSAMVATTSLQASKFYKWMDDGGTTHYGENPPDMDTAVEINVKSGASSDQQKAIDNLESQRKAAQEMRNPSSKTDANAEVEARNKEIMKRNCEMQKQNIGQLQANRRVKETNEKGEVRYLDEKEIESRIKDVQAYLDENCKD